MVVLFVLEMPRIEVVVEEPTEPPTLQLVCLIEVFVHIDIL